MSKFGFFIVLISSLFNSAIHGQSLKDDFESNRQINWVGDDCLIDTCVTNPFAQGLNTSSKVLKYNDVGGLYANVRINAGFSFDLQSCSVFSVKIYVPSNGMAGTQTNQIALKLQNGDLATPWSTQSEIIKPLVLDQWQTIQFNFKTDPYINLDPNSPNPMSRLDFNRIVIQVNGENNTSKVMAYLDDFFYEGAVSVFKQLVWSDECNGNGAVDSSLWFAQTQLPNGNAWFNGELQHYTNRTINAKQNNGCMSITALKEQFTDQAVTKQYTSARLNSKFAFKYGRVEVRAKLPFGVGTWPAIWMLGKNIIEPGAYWSKSYGQVNWPACGEIDIMEHWGSNQNYVQSAIHTPSSFGNTINLGGRMMADVANTFHVYALEWTASKLVFKVDEQVHYTYSPTIKDANTWPFDQEHYLLLNVAINPSIASSFNQSSMLIDYVRVYQVPQSNLTQTTLPLNTVYPNPTSAEVMFPQIQAPASIKIFSLLGIELMSVDVTSNEQSVDVSALSPGTYLLQIVQDGQVSIQKLIKD